MSSLLPSPPEKHPVCVSELVGTDAELCQDSCLAHWVWKCPEGGRLMTFQSAQLSGWPAFRWDSTGLQR